MNREIKGDAGELEYILPTSDKARQFISYWSSPEALAKEIEGWDKNKAWQSAGWKLDYNDENDSCWYGSRDMESAIKLAREGWPEGVTAASKFLSRIRANNPIQLKRVKHAVVGSYPNVPRAVAGNPLNMRTPDITKASRRPVITFLSDTCVSWNHGSIELTNRAALVAALVEQVEAAGYACDVIVFSHSVGGGMWSGGDSNLSVTNWIQVKNSNQPVDISRIAFGMGHPSMFRRFMFATEGYHHFNQGLGHSLGVVSSFDHTKTMADRNMYIIPSVQSTNFFKTETEAETKGLKFIMDALDKQGFPLFEDGFDVNMSKPLLNASLSKRERKRQRMLQAA